MPALQEHEPSEPAAAQPVPPPPQLSIEERRQIIYSSVLRYRDEHVSLRDRALNRAVAGALLGSTEEEPFRVGKIQENLRYRPDAPLIRTGAIQDALRRLMGMGLAAQTEVMKRHAYYLTPQGNEDVGEVVTSSEELFNAVLKGVFRDTRGTVDPEVGSVVFRKFGFQCFARFGQVVARNVAGHINHDTLLRSADVEAAFQAAVASIVASIGKEISAEGVESLRARCFAFLRSQEPDAQRLKFHLTQGYYVAQLLGLENPKFDPLSVHAFNGSVFYLDTNVLLVGLVYANENARLFEEMVGIAGRIGIELRVTRATIDEARRIAADRRALLREIDEVIPKELALRTDDQFVEGYLDAHGRNPELTPDEFLAPFDRLAETIVGRFGLVIDDRMPNEIFAGRDFSRVADVMNEAAEYTRRYGKKDEVLDHDVCHYVAIQDLRATGTKAWFLTRDRSLELAASRLAGDEPLFAFHLIGFLHTISPFLTTVNEEQPFADVFSDFLAANLFPAENLFDAQELAIMAEFHADVMSAPPDVVVQAFNYVKSHTLDGKPYRRSDTPNVSLALKKFFMSTRDARLAEAEADRERLAAERTRLAAEKEEERRKREAREAEAARLQGELSGEIERREIDREAAKTRLAAARRQMTAQERQFAVRQQRARGIVAAGGLAAGAFIWGFNDAIVTVLAQKMPALLPWSQYAVLGLNAIGALLFCLPTFVFVYHTRWHEHLKAGLYALLILLALVFSRLFTKDEIADLANYFDVVGMGVLLVLAAIAIGRIGRREKDD